MSKKHKYALICIVAVAVFFRFWQFSSIPNGLYQDEAMNGADALASLQSGDYRIFYTNNNGREGLIIWLDALAIKLFGSEPWVLRLFPAMAGLLAVLGLYFLAKELFGEKIALASSFFMAVSFWAVNFSRMGFRAGLMVPILVWSFYFLLRGFYSDRHRMSIAWFVLAGILFGLGFYTYIPFRFAPILALLALGPLLLNKKSKPLWSGVIFFVVAVFIVALPIGLYFLNNPADFFGRSSGVSVFSQDSPIKALSISVVTTLGMFNIVGDFNWRHNYAGAPELFLPVGLLFLLGLVLSVKRRAFGDRLLLSWFIIFLLPNFLASEGNPHALRAIGAMPAVMIFSGIGFVWVYKKIQKYFDNKIGDSNFSKYNDQLLRLKKETTLFFIVFLIFVGGYNFNQYFTRWASNQAVANAFSLGHVSIARYLNDLPEETKIYALWHSDDRATDNGLPVSAQTVYFLTSQKTKINYLKSNELDRIILGQNGTVIVPLYFNSDLLHAISNKFPGGKINFVDLNAAAVIIP